MIRLKENKVNEISVKEFIGMNLQQIKIKLDDLPVDTIITGIRNKSGKYYFDTVITKEGSYKTVYYNRFGLSPSDCKYHDVYWTIGGYECPCFEVKLFGISSPDIIKTLGSSLIGKP